MTFRQPLIYRWRQQKPRLTIHLAKIAHPPTAHGAPTKQPYPHYGLTPPKSDRLLDCRWVFRFAVSFDPMTAIGASSPFARAPAKDRSPPDPAVRPGHLERRVSRRV